MAQALAETGVAEVHVSDINEFLKCRRSWNWSSRFRGNLTPNRIYRPFFTGRIVHAAMEDWYARGAPMPDDEKDISFELLFQDAYNTILWEELGPWLPLEAESPAPAIRDDMALMDTLRMMPDEIEELKNELLLIKGMLEHYALWENRNVGPFALRNLEFLSVEQEFNVPIVHPATGEVHKRARYAGKWDELVRRRDNGDVYVWEIKTTSRPEQRAKMLLNDPQCTHYLNACEQAFPELRSKIKGMLYTLMAKRVPRMPKVLNNGMLSTDIRGQSFDSFVRFITAHHGLSDWTEDARRQFIISHYGAQLQVLLRSQNRENTFFERHLVVRNEAARYQGRLDLWHIADAMTDPNLPMYPTPGFGCSYCLFHEPCIALQNGQNVDTILRTSYIQRDYTPEETSDE